MVELIYFVIIAALSIRLLKKDKQGLKTVAKDFWGVTKRYFFYVLFIILAASIMQECIPKEVIVKYLGEGKLYSPILAALVASIFEGPTIIAFVLGETLLSKGAGIASTIAFISAFSMVGIYSVPLEQKELGKVFPIVRLVVTMIFAVIIGLVCSIIV